MEKWRVGGEQTIKNEKNIRFLNDNRKISRNTIYDTVAFGHVQYIVLYVLIQKKTIIKLVQNI